MYEILENKERLHEMEIDNSQPKVNFKSRIDFVTHVLRKDIIYFN